MLERFPEGGIDSKRPSHDLVPSFFGCVSSFVCLLSVGDLFLSPPEDGTTLPTMRQSAKLTDCSSLQPRSSPPVGSKHLTDEELYLPQDDRERSRSPHTLLGRRLNRLAPHLYPSRLFVSTTLLDTRFLGLGWR